MNVTESSEALAAESIAPDQTKNQKTAEMLARILNQAGPRFSEASFANYASPLPDQQAAVEALKDYATKAREHTSNGRGIVLFGPSGTGKDHLLIATARQILSWASCSFRWVNGPGMYSELRDAIERDQTEDQWIERYCSPHVLILSDPVPPRGTVTDYQASMLYNVVDRRWRGNKATWCSLNVRNRHEADERLTPAITDRLRDGAICIFTNWTSFRTPQT